ncbi:MAG: hypothetical protein PHH57_07135 [Candidatus Omnitrophica bacterium]|nr:hypothetical protein [Candidatus Omnitrophota bacterium]
MREYLGKKVLWVTPKTTRLLEHPVRCAIVRELSPSGEYVIMEDEQWYPIKNIQVLEVLDEGSPPAK